MIKHLVLVKFRADATDAEISGAIGGLRNLVGNIPGLLDFCGGAYVPGEGLNRGFTHAFVMTFESIEHRDGYLVHPLHAATAEAALPYVDGGLAGVVAFDFET